MFAKITSKILSALILGSLFGIFEFRDYATWAARGRAAFMEHQSYRWDHYVVHVHPTTAVAAIILMVFIFGLYELLARAIFWIVSKIGNKEKSKIAMAHS